MERMFPRLTEHRCDCCDGERFVDEVGLIAVCDAVRSFRDAIVEKAGRDESAWADAHAAIAAAQAQAGGTAA